MWYAIDLPRDEYPWLYAEHRRRRTTQGNAPMLELLATLVLLKIIDAKCPSQPRWTTFLTDSQAGAYMVPKLSTKAPAGTALLAELALHTYSTGTHLALSHVYRETNTWADRLTNGDYAGFDPSLRAHFSMSDPGAWYILPDLLPST